MSAQTIAAREGVGREGQLSDNIGQLRKPARSLGPFQAVYADGVLRPLQRFHNALAAEFGEGEVVTLERREGRSRASHNAYFAQVEEAWSNIPEHMAERWATPDHLRRWALIKAGYRDERSIACASKAEALRVAAFVRPLDEYAVVVVREAVVTVLTAKSQSLKAMGKVDFQDSKTKVLDVLADLIGADPRRAAQ